MPPINSSGDIYHIIAYIIPSKKCGVSIPSIVLSYDTSTSTSTNTNTSMEKGADLDTKTQVMRGINFADDLEYGDLFQNPFESSAPIEQSTVGKCQQRS